MIYPLVTGLVLAATGGQWLLGQARATLQEKPAHASALVATLPPSTSDTVTPHRQAGYQPRIETGALDYHGAEVAVACMTCHTSKTPNTQTGLGGTVPQGFHHGLTYTHGGQTCLSCHNPGDYDALRLADGRKLAFADAQLLCAQCHGPQTRNYLHGSHGGMSGYWDKTKGERARNTCTDCHDPHAPAYPAWTPVFAPKDAGAKQQLARESAHAGSSPTLSHHD
jgi:formate-dependent nitrite reductase cytochrome c552 subunit